MLRVSRALDSERNGRLLGSDLNSNTSSIEGDRRRLMDCSESITDVNTTSQVGRWLPVLACLCLFGAFDYSSHGQAVLRSERQTEAVPFSKQGGELQNLCQLIAQRLALIEEVAKTKWNTGSPIEDPEREQQILSNVGAKATVEGIPAQYAQHFFRLQMEASKRVEYELFATWKAKKQDRNFHALDLKSDIRPRLDSIDIALLRELKRNLSTLASHNSENSVQACRGEARFPDALTIAMSPLIDRSAEMSGSVPVAARSLP